MLILPIASVITIGRFRRLKKLGSRYTNRISIKLLGLSIELLGLSIITKFKMVDYRVIEPIAIFRPRIDLDLLNNYNFVISSLKVPDSYSYINISNPRTRGSLILSVYTINYPIIVYYF